MRNGDMRESVLSDVAFVAQHLRDADRQEIAACSGEHPLVALFRSFMDSAICQTILAPDGEPVGLFGVVPSHDPLVGTCWALMTDRLREVRYEFVRRNRAVLDLLNTQWPVLHNYVDQRNTVHIAWLRRMGFTFLRVIPGFGAEQRPFIEFVRVAHV